MAVVKRSSRIASRQSARQTSVPKKSSAGSNRYRAPAKKWHMPKLSPISTRGARSTVLWLFLVGFGFVMLGGISIGLLYGYRYLTISPYFALKTIEIQGNFRLGSREVLEIAGIDQGANSLELSIDGIEQGLLQNPWIQSVGVQRTLPDGLRIVLKEKEPRFWVQRDGVLCYADVYGTPIAMVQSEKFSSFPALEIERGGEEMVDRLPDLIRSLSESKLPIDMRSVSMVRLSPGRGIEVYLDANRLVLSIGQEEWLANLQRLAATLQDIDRRGELPQVREVRAHGASVWVIVDKPVAAARQFVQRGEG